MNAHQMDRRMNMVLVACAAVTFVIVAVMLPSVKAGSRDSAALRAVAKAQEASQTATECRAQITADNQVAFGDVLLKMGFAFAATDPTQARADLQAQMPAVAAELDRTQMLRRKINEICK